MARRPSGWALAVLLLATWLCSPALAGTLEIQAPARRISVDPGGVASVALELHGAAAVPLTEGLVLPAGWTSLLPSTGLSASPGPSTRILAVGVPPRAQAGTHPLVYRLLDGEQVVHEVEIPVRVARAPELEVELVEVPAAVVAGRTAVARARVANRGNVPLRATLGGASPAGSVMVEPAEVDLAPGQSAELTVGVRSDRDATGEQIVTLQARGGASVEHADWFHLQVVGRRSAGRHRTLPTTATLSVGASEQGVAGQVDLGATGFLDRDDQVQLDLRIRTPDAMGSLPWPMREELRAEVRSPWVDVAVGDRVWRSTRLLDPYRYGRGVGVDLHPGRVRAGVWLAQSRLESARPWVGTAHTGVELGRVGSIQLTGQHRWSLEDLSQETGGSVSAELHPVDGTDLTVELGVGERGGRADLGYAIEARTELSPDTVATFEHLHAGPGFAGPLADSERSHGALSHTVVMGRSRLRLYGQAHRTRRNLDRDRSQPSALRYDGVRAGADLLVGSAWSLRAAYVGASSIDRLDPTSGYADHGAQLAVGRTGRLASAHLDLLAGDHHDLGADQHLPATRIGLRLAVRPPRGPSVSAYGRWSTSDSSMGSLSTSRTVGARLQWDGAIRVQASSQLMLTDRPTAQSDLHASWQLSPRSSVSLRGRHRHALGTEEHEAAAMLSFTVHTGVPVGPSATTGAVRGRLYDADDPEGAAISGALVVVDGAAAMTRRDGRFTVRGVRPGPQVVHVDHRALGMDQVIDASLPLRVEVEPGVASTLSLGTVRAATLQGVVAMADPDGQTATDTDGVYVVGAAADPSQPLAGVRVVLSREGERVVEVTDQRGGFSFAGLRPGSWRVELSGLPPRHRAEAHTVVLDPGEEERVELGVEAVRRRVELVEVGGGSLSLESRPRVGHAEVVDLDIGRAEVTLPAGGRVALGAAAILVDGRRVDASGRVRWVSRDPAIATVDERGVVHAISAGSTGIYAEWQGVLAPAVRIVVEE